MYEFELTRAIIIYLTHTVTLWMTAWIPLWFKVGGVIFFVIRGLIQAGLVMVLHSFSEGSARQLTEIVYYLVLLAVGAFQVAVAAARLKT